MYKNVRMIQSKSTLHTASFCNGKRKRDAVLAHWWFFVMDIDWRSKWPFSCESFPSSTSPLNFHCSCGSQQPNINTWFSTYLCFRWVTAWKLHEQKTVYTCISEHFREAQSSSPPGHIQSFWLTCKHLYVECVMTGRWSNTVLSNLWSISLDHNPSRRCTKLLIENCSTGEVRVNIYLHGIWVALQDLLSHLFFQTSSA